LEIKKLPLEKSYFLKKGYIFIWIEKEFISDLFFLFDEKGYNYVDNLTWVNQQYK
jgi:hypothetical protein